MGAKAGDTGPREEREPSPVPRVPASREEDGGEAAHAAKASAAWRWGVALGPPIASVTLLADDSPTLGRLATLFGCTRPRRVARGDLRLEGRLPPAGEGCRLVSAEVAGPTLTSLGALVRALDETVERHVAAHLPDDFRLLRGAAVLAADRRAVLVLGGEPRAASLVAARLCEAGLALLSAGCVPVRTDPPSLGRWRRPLALPDPPPPDAPRLVNDRLVHEGTTWHATGALFPVTRQRLFPLGAIACVDSGGAALAGLEPAAARAHVARALREAPGARADDERAVDTLVRAVRAYRVAPAREGCAALIDALG